MGQSWVHIEGKSVVDWDRADDTVAVPATSAETLIVAQRCKMGKKPYLVSVKQAWDAAMDEEVQWTVKVNGNILPRFPYTTVQFAGPGTETKLPVRQALSQGDLVEIWAYSTVAGNVSAAIDIEYEDF